MKVLVDTPIWSCAFRSQNRRYQSEVNAFAALIAEQQVSLIGPIRQEILSGYSDFRKYQKLKEKLSYFQNTPIVDADYEQAAECCNDCRKRGIQGSHIDFLICAVAVRLEMPIFTTDKDFDRYQTCIPIRLYAYK